MTGDHVRVGIVGLGNIAHHHAERILDLGHTIAAGADISEEACARFSEAYGARTYQSHADMYREADIDAVIITTPNKFHEECATTALEAGLDVLLEKPLAHTLESAQEIAVAAENADGFCMVGFNNRFTESVEVLKSYQDQGEFGDTRHVEANFIRRRGIPGRGSWFTNKEVAGGGALIDIGVHAIDLALHVLDFPDIVEVSGVVRSQFGDREDYTCLNMWGDDQGPDGFNVGDSATAFIRCADGKTINLEVAWATNRESSEEFVVRGTDAGARFELGGDDMTVYESAGDGADHFADTEIQTNGTDTHTAEQEMFLDAVANGETPERNTVSQALDVQRVIDAIYRSHQTNRAVEVDSSSASESEATTEGASATLN